MTILVSIDTAARICRRYSGHTETHGFLLEHTAVITPEMVDAMIHFPETVGEPEEKERA